MKKEVINVLGDSHMLTWGYISRKNLLPEYSLNVVKASTASATGLFNKKSKSKSNKIFIKALQKSKDNPYTIMALGEVDCNCTFWLKLRRKKIDIDDQIEYATENIVTFIKSRASGIVILAGATLPACGNHDGLRRHGWDIKISQAKRTDVTHMYNNVLKEKATNNGYLYMDINEDLVDNDTGLINRDYCIDDYNHHLRKNMTGKLWAKKLRKTIKDRKKND